MIQPPLMEALEWARKGMLSIRRHSQEPHVRAALKQLACSIHPQLNPRISAAMENHKHETALVSVLSEGLGGEEARGPNDSHCGDDEVQTSPDSL